MHIIRLLKQTKFNDIIVSFRISIYELANNVDVVLSGSASVITDNES